MKRFRTLHAATADEFYARLEHLTAEQRHGILLEGRDGGAISLIMYDSRDYNARNPRNNADVRKARATVKAAAVVAEQERLTMVVENRRRMVSRTTWEAMPRPRRVDRTPEQVQQDRKAGIAFFHSLARSSSANRIARIVREGEPGIHWMLANPYGGPVTDEEIAAMVTWIRQSQPVKRRKREPGIRPAGMTYQRALAIAVAVLDSQQ